MISPQMATDIVTPYPPTMQDLEKKVESLNEINSNQAEVIKTANARIEAQRGTIQTYERQIESVKAYIMDRIAESDFDEDTANNIADILGFELEKEVSFEVTVRFFGSAKIGPGDDAESLITDLNYDMNGGYYNNLEFDVEDVIVDSVDISEY